MRRDRGFTVIELMVTLAVLAVIAMFGIPSFERLMEKMRLVRATQPVHEMLVYAQSEAVKRFRPIVVSLRAGGTTWSVGVTDDVADRCDPAPSSTNLCTIDADNNATTTGDLMLIRTGSVDLPGANMSNPSFPVVDGVASTIFEGVRGLPSASGSVDLSTDHFEVRVEVAVTGRIRICSPNDAKRVSWYPDC